MYEDQESSVIQYRSYRAIRPREIDQEDSFSLQLVHSTTLSFFVCELDALSRPSLLKVHRAFNAA